MPKASTASPKSAKLGAEKLTPDDGLAQSKRFVKAAQ